MFSLKFLRRLIVLFITTLIVSPRAGLAQDQRAVFDLVVNQTGSGEATVVLRGTDVLIPVTRLEQAGLRGFQGAREESDGETLVSLASLQPAVSFALDDRELRLHLTVSPELLGQQVRDLYSGAPAGLVYKADTSGFLNYSVNYSSGRQVDSFFESAISMKGAVVYNSLSASRESATRGLTSVTVDQRALMRRWTFGDSLAYSGPLGGDAWLAGVTLAKEFSIDPYFVRHPRLTLSTPILIPSVMEVQVNGQVVSREPVAPGRLELRNLPMTIGRNDAQVIVRDAFGVERELTSTYYLTTSTLARGVQDYQYSVGFRRESVGLESWDYRSPVAVARHRVGVSDSVTAGGRLELEAGHLFSSGPTLNLRLPFGEVEAATSVSRSAAEWGHASLVGFHFVGRPVSAGGVVRVASPRYATLTPNRPGEYPTTEASLFASASIGGPLSMTAQHTRTRLYQGITRDRSGLMATIHLARNLELTASASQTEDEHGRAREAYGGVTILFGRSSASVAHVRDARGNRMAVDAQRSLPVGEGYGYQLHAEGGETGIATGVARYQGRHGRYELRQESVAGRTSTTVSVMGSIVGIGGGLYASRPVQDSFALIRVPGVEGVRAYSSHQTVGKTNKSGDLLVPDLQAYYGNTLGIADSDVPIAYSVTSSGQIMAVPYRGGAVALFPVKKVQRVVGTVTLVEDGRERVPAYGEIVITIEGAEIASPVGGSGAFYFEDLPGGTHAARVRDGGGHDCTFQMTVPASDDLVVDLGNLRCEVRRP